MEKKELKQMCLKLMETADVMYLSTIDSDGFPQTRAMANLRNIEQSPGMVEMFKSHSEDFLIYIATGASSAKMEQIKANPKVSISFCNAGEVRGLMLAGSAEIITDQQLKEQLWQDDWEMYWPAGADDPEYAVVRLSPDFVKGWNVKEPFEFKLK